MYAHIHITYISIPNPNTHHPQPKQHKKKFKKSPSQPHHDARLHLTPHFLSRAWVLHSAYIRIYTYPLHYILHIISLYTFYPPPAIHVATQSLRPSVSNSNYRQHMYGFLSWCVNLLKMREACHLFTNLQPCCQQNKQKKRFSSTIHGP